MQIKTPNGIAEPMPLSDIQQNNKQLNRLIILGYLAFGYLIVMTTYIIYNNVLGNIIKTIGC